MGKDFYIKIGQQAGFLDSHNKVDNVDNKENKHKTRPPIIVFSTA